MNSRSIVLTSIKVFYYSITVFVHLIFFTFVSCILAVTLHTVDVRLTCLINITYLLTYSVLLQASSQGPPVSAVVYAAAGRWAQHRSSGAVVTV